MNKQTNKKNNLTRVTELDKRFLWGDPFSGDAYRDGQGQIVYVASGSQQQLSFLEDVKNEQ